MGFCSVLNKHLLTRKIMARVFASIIIFLLTGSLLGCITASSVGKTASDTSIDKLREEKNVQVVQLGDTLKIILATDGCFDLQGTTILRSCQPALEEAAATVLKGYGNAPIIVAGYTDNVASPSVAKLMSQRRADSIVAYLWARCGIPFQRFQAIGYGSENPVADNINSIGSAYNRRVEVKVRPAI